MNNNYQYRDPKIWGPHYWFFLHSIADCYPDYPNDTIKKKYYEIIQNFPLLIPNTRISTEFSKMLDTFPIFSYLDNKISFKKWVFFIHNKMNTKLGKKTITYDSSNEYLEQHYESKQNKYDGIIKQQKTYKSVIYAAITIGFLVFIIKYVKILKPNS
jgi:hypothetical protein